MCESSAYTLKNGKEELILEGIEILERQQDQIKIINLFGEEKTFRGKVIRFSLIDHKIILDPLQPSE